MIETKIGHTKITFDNGYTVSIANGFASYSENYNNEALLKQHSKCVSQTCEIAILKDLDFVTKNSVLMITL